MITSNNMPPELGTSRAGPSRRPAYSRLYRLGLTYLGVSILFEILSQLMFFRLIGFNAITQVMLVTRLAVDLLFIGVGLNYGISVNVFRGYVINTLTILTVYGFIVGIIGANDIFEILKDLLLFSSFILKFAIFKAIFLSDNNMDRFYARLQKYCWFTLYVAIVSFVIMRALSSLGFSFYQQGISNVDWFVAYSVATNRPIGAIFGLIVAFLLAKRMVFLSCAVIFFPWIAKRLFALSPKILLSVSAFAVVVLVMVQFVTEGPETLHYAIRIDFNEFLDALQHYSMDEVRRILIILDNPRYQESWSALEALGPLGLLTGGGFGFNYVDVHTGNTVSNAHFSPVGLITKFGFVGMLLFYHLFLMGAFKVIRARHPISVLCGYYVLATVAGSLLSWKFFLSSPLLPMALAAALYCGPPPEQRGAKQS